jgi:hypothetical protein
MAVTLDEVTMAKSGKSRRVKLSGSWYGAYLDSKIEMQPIGSLLEAEIVTLDKGGPWIKAWKASLTAAPQSAPSPEIRTGYTAPVTTAPQYAEPAKAGTVAPWWWNGVCAVWVAQTNSGNIKTPSDLSQWSTAVQHIADGDLPF